MHLDIPLFRIAKLVITASILPTTRNSQQPLILQGLFSEYDQIRESEIHTWIQLVFIVLGLLKVF